MNDYSPGLTPRKGNVSHYLRKKFKPVFNHRGYAWGEEQYIQMLKDLADTYKGGYREKDDRKAVGHYPRYYLGHIVTSEDGVFDILIDGQQRFMTLLLLVMALRQHHSKIDDGEEFDVLLGKMIFSSSYGESTFNFKAEDRIPLFEALYNNTEFDMETASDSAKNMYEAFKNLKRSIQLHIPDRALPHFTDWLLYRVYMTETIVPPDMVQTVFERLNNRGLAF